MIIGIQDEILRLHSIGVLEHLLEDKTMGVHILWATDAYKDLGEDYQRDKQIGADMITGIHSGVIRNRARKDLEQQNERTRQHAEVFTPLWICNQMNNAIDEDWFGRPGAFNADGVPTERVEFPDGRTWQEYVDDRRLEITCGEAPYLVSRYDVSTGEVIDLKSRIGILDRKLRVVGENAETEEEWLEWAVHAYNATYGYEFQGDNVLIARVNLMTTFEEYLWERWHRKPTRYEYKTISTRIVWNLWQMDGLTGTIPYCKAKEEFEQMSFDELLGIGEPDGEQSQPPCKIYDWRSKCQVEFMSINRGK